MARGATALKYESGQPDGFGSRADVATKPPRNSKLTGRVLLGLILLFGAYSKLHFNGEWHFRDYYFFFAMAIGSYRNLPFGVVKSLAVVVPWLELAVGVLLLGGIGTRWASLFASVLLLFMAFLPRAGILGLANRTNPALELLVDIGYFLVALTITLRAFGSQGVQQNSG